MRCIKIKCNVPLLARISSTYIVHFASNGVDGHFCGRPFGMFRLHQHQSIACNYCLVCCLLVDQVHRMHSIFFGFFYCSDSAAAMVQCATQTHIQIKLPTMLIISRPSYIVILETLKLQQLQEQQQQQDVALSVASDIGGWKNAAARCMCLPCTKATDSECQMLAHIYLYFIWVPFLPNIQTSNVGIAEGNLSANWLFRWIVEFHGMREGK